MHVSFSPCPPCPCCRYLLEHGAQVGAVNSEGELPLDVATEEAMERLLKAEIKKQGEEGQNEDRSTERTNGVRKGEPVR